MATMEKLVKSLEALKIHQITQPLTDDTTAARKKEKISHCLTIADAMCYSGVRSSSNFLHLLSVSIELLLQQCDDPHSDVRMIADESLNRIIRALADSNVVKIQVELHKEIKKNGSPRTLRAALWRFAELCHMIRPQKGKPYVLNLMPCIIHIARRPEEAVLETLAAAMPKIFKALGTFTTDNDIKGLLKAFLLNLSSPSAVVRRTATSSILTVCLNCRKPHVFVTYILNTLLDCIIPLHEDQSVANVLGVLGCLRNILPHVASVESSEEMRGSFGVRCRQQESPLATDRMLQVYELCLHFTNHADHNVVNAALETLCQLLQSPPGDLLHILLTPGGITRSRIQPDGPHEKLTHRTLSQMSVAMSLAPGDEAALLDPDSEMLPSLHLPSVEAWVDTITTSTPANTSPRDEERSLGLALEETSEYSNIRIGSIEDDETESIQSTTAEVGSPVRPTPLSVQSSVQSDEVKDEINLPSPSTNATCNTPFKAVNVGSLTDADVAPLTHCARHVASSFLLTGWPGHTMPDSLVRVSVKALALGCVGNVLRLHPEVFRLSLDRDEGRGCQPLADLLLFADHADPQLRGIAGAAAGALALAGVRRGDGPVSLHDLVKLLLRGLEDESSVCCRQTLATVNTCLTELLESVDSRTALPLLAALPHVVDNPYWLVKVKLVEVVSDLPYVTIHYLTGNSDFQAKVLDRVVWTLLGDEDARVRHATATALVRLTAALFYPADHHARDPVLARAASYARAHLSHPPSPTHARLAGVDGLPTPFDRRPGDGVTPALEASLSRSVGALTRHLSTSPSRHLTFGCCETLSLLSAKYPTTVFTRGWDCTEHSGLLALAVDLMTSSPVSLDLGCQLWLANLASNLFSGLAVCGMSAEPSEPRTAWGGFRDPRLSVQAERLLVHSVRSLNVFVHVMEETPPRAPPTLPAHALSPARRRGGAGGAPSDPDPRGSFAGVPHYARLHDLVKSAYNNYKTSLDSAASEKFVGLLGATLESLSRLLEVATPCEAGRIADELLAHLRVTVSVDPAATVQCVQQLLKCLFGTNLGGGEGQEGRRPPSPPPPAGLYGECLRGPYARLQDHLAGSPPDTRDRDEGSVWMNYLRRKGERKASTAFKSLNRGADKASLASYIRLFEPMVIKALKQYTVTSDVRLQCRVLLLLSQLVQLRVNYCLLDSDQIFIGFVLKQFEFIEEGQILDAQELIPKIFFFLVHLSYEKHHSKSIISVPKVIQLCDGLMASGQSPITHCIPALVPVVEDVFLVRGVGSSGIDLKELETQREVLVAMLLRLVEYYQVVELLSVVLTEAQSQVDGEERWRRWSRQVLDTLLPHLAQGRLRLESRRAQQALERLFNSVAPSVLRPCDQMLKTLFSESPHLESSLIATERWLGMVLAILLHLISYCKEEVMLARLEELDLTLPPLGSYETRDPLNVAATIQSKTQLLPEEVMARFLMRVIGLISSHLYNAVFSPVASNSWHYLHEQLSHFLLYCIYVFESGKYRRVAAAAVQLMEGSGVDGVPTSDLNALFSELAARCPLITFQWCYLVTLLGFNDEGFWARILRTQFSTLQDSLEKNSSVPSPCINLEIVRKGGTILYCDYVCENVGDAEVLTWLLVNHIEEVVSLSHESPVQELIAAVHRNSAASGLLVQAIASRCTHLTKPSLVSRLLRCLWSVHPTQSGALLLLLIPRLLGLQQLALARQAGALACRRAELLLTLTHEEVAKQLPHEDLRTLLDLLHNEGLAKKHSGLVSLLNKLGGQCYNMVAVELELHKAVDPESIRSIKVDEAWFLSQVKQRCCQRDASGMESAQLLSQLSYDDIVNVLASPKINVSTLQECIQLGTQLTLQAAQRQAQDDSPPLYRASQLSLLNAIQNVRSLLPRPHHVFEPQGRDPTPKEVKYSKRLDGLFADETFWGGFFEIAPAVSCYMDSLAMLAGPGVPPQEFWQSLAKFGILCLEALSWLILTQSKPKPQCLELGLRCADLILRDPNLSAVIGQTSNVSYLGSATSAITRVVLLLTEGEPLPSIQTSALSATLLEPDNVSAGHACIQMATLVSWLEQTHLKLANIPEFLSGPIRSLVVSLSRMPLVNSFVATPPDVWRQGWCCDLIGPARTTVPPLPVEYLQDIDLLQQFIFRVTLLGWTSRQQFEETWMAFLSLLNSNPAENSAPEEVSLMIQASSLAVEAITALLIQTLLLPVPGNPNTSSLVHQPREKTLATSEDSAKLRTVQELLGWKLNTSRVTTFRPGNVFHRANMERINNPNKYGYSQVSLEYLWTATRILEEGDNEKVTVSALCLTRERCLAATGLDLHSCLHFMLDLYSQWLQPNSGTPLRLLNRAVNSVLAISDLFAEKAQFQWLLSTFLELGKTHPSEDEPMHQYLVLGVCKAAAVIRADSETLERVRKAVESGLRSAFLPTRIASLHGLLYLLQNNADQSVHILPLAVEYIQKHIDGWANQSEEHNLLMWGLVFYLMETVEEIVMETELSPVVLQLALTLASSNSLPESLHLALLNGLERLVISRAIVGKVSEQVTKLAVERLRHPSPVVSLPGLQLLLTCMYTGRHRATDSDPEHLIQAMEKTSAMFERIKRGYPSEVELLCGVLPHVLTDFFPPSEVLTKVIGEFLSPQQPHPRQLAAVVFQVFDQACQQLIQDWVVLSLANFTQCSPIGMASWCVTCFFISASTNPWLRSLFPHVQSRIGRLELQDRKLLYVAAKDFYGQLTDESQKQTFVSTFDSAVQSPFSELITFL